MKRERCFNEGKRIGLPPSPSDAEWGIFLNVSGVLHYAGYLEKFAHNLKRELPRIPLAPALAEDELKRERGRGRGKKPIERE